MPKPEPKKKVAYLPPDELASVLHSSGTPRWKISIPLFRTRAKEMIRQHSSMNHKMSDAKYKELVLRGYDQRRGANYRDVSGD